MGIAPSTTTSAVLVRNTLNLVRPKLFVGGRGAAENTRLIRSLGIDSIIMMCPIGNGSVVSRKGINFAMFPAEDNVNFDFRKMLLQAAHRLSSELAAGRTVLVHCESGISRSVSVVVLYLMARYNLSYAKAMGLVKAKRHVAGPNPAFVALLQKLDKEMQNQRTKGAAVEASLLASGLKKAHFEGEGDVSIYNGPETPESHIMLDSHGVL